MTARLRITVLLIIILAVTPAFGAQKAKGPQDSEAPAAEDTGPMPVLDDIAEGWTSGDADLILRHFGSGKVIIMIDGSGPGGSFSKDQGYYLFKELFKATITRKFVFVQVRSSNAEGKSPFAIAERRYQRRDDGRQVKDKVYIALHLERGGDSSRWVLDEIKSIR
jgi:hypothetical protein